MKRKIQENVKLIFCSSLIKKRKKMESNEKLHVGRKLFLQTV